jgi:hypothetical protein
MNTFLALQQEGINTINFVKPLTTRIYERGLREQYNGIYLSHYYPNAPKRVAKSVSSLRETLAVSMGIRRPFKS